MMLNHEKKESAFSIIDEGIPFCLILIFIQKGEPVTPTGRVPVWWIGDYLHRHFRWVVGGKKIPPADQQVGDQPLEAMATLLLMKNQDANALENINL
ncbi:hypothetical protein CEXT_811001 [Caerostris extrusa]|uniref:Uncharacterized protein n=1 Tax=Caerostris extrusa TaxID=172846 RepID=A0AAV4Q5K2_CAEEX|nr:hypothetical protein CEXT_811001 [Caerostris extrusa]